MVVVTHETDAVQTLVLFNFTVQSSKSDKALGLSTRNFRRAVSQLFTVLSVNNSHIRHDGHIAHTRQGSRWVRGVCERQGGVRKAAREEVGPRERIADYARAPVLYSTLLSSCHDHTFQQNVSNRRLCARTSSVSDCIGPSESESLTGLVPDSSCWARLRCYTRHLGHTSTHGPATSSGKVASFPPHRNREFEGKLLCRSLATQLRSESVVH